MKARIKKCLICDAELLNVETYSMCSQCLDAYRHDVALINAGELPEGNRDEDFFTIARSAW